MSEDFKDLLLRLDWAPEAWRPIAGAFILEMRLRFRERGVEETGPVSIHVRDVLAHLLYVLDLEQQWTAQPDTGDGKEGREAKREVNLPLLDALGKAWERVRKAMRELGDTCAKMGTPIDIGLADIIKPVLQKAEGVLDDATEFEARKKKCAARSNSPKD